MIEDGFSHYRCRADLSSNGCAPPARLSRIRHIFTVFARYRQRSHSPRKVSMPSTPPRRNFFEYVMGCDLRLEMPLLITLYARRHRSRTPHGVLLPFICHTRRYSRLVLLGASAIWRSKPPLPLSARRYRKFHARESRHISGAPHWLPSICLLFRRARFTAPADNAAI